MISEESCDTEDWSNDAEITGIHYILKYIKQKNIILNSNTGNVTVLFCIFDQINEGLMSKRHAMFENINIVMFPHFWAVLYFCMITERASQLQL